VTSDFATSVQFSTKAGHYQLHNLAAQLFSGILTVVAFLSLFAHCLQIIDFISSQKDEC
jgi:hypothetical protein